MSFLFDELSITIPPRSPEMVAGGNASTRQKSSFPSPQSCKTSARQNSVCLALAYITTKAPQDARRVRVRGYSMSTTLAQWTRSSWFFGVWSRLDSAAATIGSHFCTSGSFTFSASHASAMYFSAAAM